jgi:hypothetical protein
MKRWQSSSDPTLWEHRQVAELESGSQTSAPTIFSWYPWPSFISRVSRGTRKGVKNSQICTVVHPASIGGKFSRSSVCCPLLQGDEGWTISSIQIAEILKQGASCYPYGPYPNYGSVSNFEYQYGPQGFCLCWSFCIQLSSPEGIGYRYSTKAW